MTDRKPDEAIAAGALGAAGTADELLGAIVAVARAIFGARAASVLLYDERSDELVFAVSSGEGAEELVGARFPGGSGIAGFVLATRQPLVLEDVQNDPRFARGVAESTGYVPRGLMAVPLLRGDRALGVLEVLDRRSDARFTLADMDLLGLFGTQAAIALDLLGRARRAQEGFDGDDELSELARLASALGTGDEERQADVAALLRTLRRLLGS